MDGANQHQFQSRRIKAVRSTLLPDFLKRCVSAGLLCATVLSLTSCMTFTLEGFGPNDPETTQGTSTTHGSLYGFMWAAPEVEKCIDHSQLFRVRFHTNAGYLAASFVSLGLYVPQTVEWWCTVPLLPPPPPAEEELYNPFTESETN